MGTKRKRIFCLLVAMVFLLTNTSVMSVFAEEAAKTSSSDAKSQQSDEVNSPEKAETTRNAETQLTTEPIGETDDSTEPVSGNEISDSQTDKPDRDVEQGAALIDVKAGANNRTVYFDATLSKVNYSDGTSADNNAPGGNLNNSIPLANGKVYYIAWSSTDASNSTYGEMTKETPYSDGTNTWNDVWSVSLSDEYDYIRFANTQITDHNGSDKYGGMATDDLKIPTDDNMCFYADNGDTSVYYEQHKTSAETYFRGGKWGKVHTVTTRGNDITHAALGTENQDSRKLYVNTTFYDYYSDLELDGFDRANLDAVTNNPPTLGYSNRTYMTHRIFNMALSDYYKDKTVTNPLYFGHFQWKYNSEGTYFKSIANDMNLYGYANNKDWFYHINNSEYRSDHDQCNEDETTNNHSTHETAVATQGLVANTLDTNENLQLQNGVTAPFFNKAFLEGANSYNTALGKVYDSVSFPFTKDGDYWKFDSKQTNLRMTYDSAASNYFLKETSDSVSGYTNGAATTDGNFFPFDDKDASGNVNELNYAFGMKMEINFRLTEDGTIKDSNGQTQDITFNFSGDDDIWIFIDGKLALDIGGGHGVVSGDLNFHSKTATVSAAKTSTAESANVTNSFTLSGSNTDQHTLTMYYMERGLWESNMLVTFNFPDDNVFAVEKEVDTSNVNSLFTSNSTFSNNVKNLDFDFDIQNLATHYSACTVDAMNAAEAAAGFIMKQQDIADYGSVTSGKAEPATGAKYSLLTRNSDNTTSLIGSANGNTVADTTVSLKDNQLAKFSNKFRRGSYIVVNEKVSPMIKTLSGLSGTALDQLSLTDIFDTTYTIYDSDNEISTANLQKSTDWTTGSSLSSVKNISGITAKDGRTEKLVDGNTDLNGTTISNTTITEKPSAAVLFRNYTNPDSETVPVDLSVKYVNKFKTGAIAVTKAQAADSAALNSNTEYSFTVTFDNAAGLKLEDTLNASYGTTTDNKLTQTFKLKVGETYSITGIPAGTNYTITETTPTDGSTLTSVTDSLAIGTAPAGIGKDSVTITGANTVNGTIAADTTTASVQTFTFYNSKQTTSSPPVKPVISVSGAKTWSDNNNAENTRFDSITIELQRKISGSSADYQAVTDSSGNAMQKTITAADSWKYSFTNLEQYVDYTASPLQAYEYRVVEVKAGDTAVSNNIVGKYQVSYSSSTDQNGNVTYNITNTLQTDSTPTPDPEPEEPKLTSLSITKVDASDTGKTLKGAVFQLQKLTSDGSVDSSFTAQKLTTPENGVIIFQNLSDGTYSLKETQAPSGYVLLTSSVTITIKNGKYTLGNNVEKTINNNIISFIVKNSVKKTSTTPDTNKNTPNSGTTKTATTVKLPQTGGMGTILFTLIGVICMGGAMLLFFHIKKKSV